MPEPNLPPLHLYDSSDPCSDGRGSLDINEFRSSMPELPEATRQRLMREYSLNLETAVIYVASEMCSKFYYYCFYVASVILVE